MIRRYTVSRMLSKTLASNLEDYFALEGRSALHEMVGALQKDQARPLHLRVMVEAEVEVMQNASDTLPSPR